MSDPVDTPVKLPLPMPTLEEAITRLEELERASQMVRNWMPAHNFDRGTLTITCPKLREAWNAQEFALMMARYTVMCFKENNGLTSPKPSGTVSP